MEGEWELGGEELLVECTEGITRKCKNQPKKERDATHFFFSNSTLTLTKYSDRALQ